MRLRYRRSLASRVILLTTFAVGLSVAIVAVAAYLTVRHQLRASLDSSLHQRAEYSARFDPTQYPLARGLIAPRRPHNLPRTPITRAERW